MGVRRTRLAFEGHFTQVPNAWVRDQRLSRKARGLLAEIMSHSIGWRVTVAGLMASGPEGRDAIMSALTELRNLGYLVVAQGRGAGGRFGEIEYELHDPTTATGLSGNGSTATGKSAPIRRTSVKNTRYQEDVVNTDLPIGGQLTDAQTKLLADSVLTFWTS